MWRKGGKSREVRSVAFPVVNRNGSDRLVYVYCIASLAERGSPKTSHHGFAEVLFRYRGVASEKDPLWTFFDTIPSKIHIVGDSFQLAVVIADRMTRYGFSKSETIIATGCLPDHDGTVGVVDEAEFDRKLDLLFNEAPPNSLFIFPKGNSVEATHDKLRRLREERGVNCKPIENLDEVKFLWETDGAIIGTKVVTAGFVALAIVVYIVWRWGQDSPPVESWPVSAEVISRSVNTAGENGAYHTQMCPRLLVALSKVGIQGYKCTPSKGTPENIERVLENPTNISFVQLDVYAKKASEQPEKFKKKLSVIRSDIACEGLWMVTKNPTLNNYSEILASAQDIAFILPAKESGSAASFAFLQTNDLKRLGHVPEINKRYVDDATAVLNEVANDDSAVGFFVQFAHPENADIKLMAQKKLKVIPVVSNEILDIRQNGLSVYQRQTFNLRSRNIFAGAMEATTACALVAVITGAPEEAFGSDRDKINAQRRLIQKVHDVPAEELRPQESQVTAIIGYAGALTEKVMEELAALVENMRRMIERLSK